MSKSNATCLPCTRGASKCVASLSPVKYPLFPPSAVPPLSFSHDLELFGRKFQVRLSTGCTFAPDTLLRAVADISWDAMLRQQAPRYHLSMRSSLIP
jgi:hypothetical protein